MIAKAALFTIFMTYGIASAEIVLDPGTPLELNLADGVGFYTNGQGALFHANTDFTLYTVGLTSHFYEGISVTYEVYQVSATVGDVLTGSTLLGSNTFDTTNPDYASHTASIGSISLISGNDYLVRAVYEGDAINNWNYIFDPELFDDSPVDLGEVTLLDGTAGGNTFSRFLPEFTLNSIPAPSSALMLGIAGFISFPRRR